MLRRQCSGGGVWGPVSNRPGAYGRKQPAIPERYHPTKPTKGLAKDGNRERVGITTDGSGGRGRGASEVFDRAVAGEEEGERGCRVQHEPDRGQEPGPDASRRRRTLQAGWTSPIAPREEQLAIDTPRRRKRIEPTPPVCYQGADRVLGVHRPAAGKWRGWGRCPTQDLLEKGRGWKAGPRKNDRASDGIPPPLFDREAPGSQEARRVADCVVQMEL